MHERGEIHASGGHIAAEKPGTFALLETSRGLLSRTLGKTTLDLEAFRDARNALLCQVVEDRVGDGCVLSSGEENHDLGLATMELNILLESGEGCRQLMFEGGNDSLLGN